MKTINIVQQFETMYNLCCSLQYSIRKKIRLTDQQITIFHYNLFECILGMNAIGYVDVKNQQIKKWTLLTGNQYYNGDKDK